MVAVSLPGVVRCPLVVGRDAELAAISALLNAVGSGSGGALMLDADAGLGKSRLVAEAVVRARAAGIQIAAGRASASAAVPYRVLSEALVAMTGRQGPPDDRRIDPYRPVLGRLAPGWPSEASRPTCLRKGIPRALSTLSTPRKTGTFQRGSTPACHALRSALIAACRTISAAMRGFWALVLTWCSRT